MRRLLIFVKEPVPGQVKTRLAAEIGAEAACRVYRRCVERTLERLVALRDEITLCVEPAEAMGRLQAWLGSAWPVQPQHGATLGERLAHATDSAFAEGMRPVIVIGTDSPWIDHLLIEEAFSAMPRTDLVLGPTADGGYYLVGLTKPAPGLFRGISWSTSQVVGQTLATARASGMTSALLPEGYDIDRLTELQRWMQEDPACGLPHPLPHPAQRRGLRKAQGLRPAAGGGVDTLFAAPVQSWRVLRRGAPALPRPHRERSHDHQTHDTPHAAHHRGKGPGASPPRRS